MTISIRSGKRTFDVLYQEVSQEKEDHAVKRINDLATTAISQTIRSAKKNPAPGTLRKIERKQFLKEGFSHVFGSVFVSLKTKNEISEYFEKIEQFLPLKDQMSTISKRQLRSPATLAKMIHTLMCYSLPDIGVPIGEEFVDNTTAYRFINFIEPVKHDFFNELKRSIESIDEGFSNNTNDCLFNSRYTNVRVDVNNIAINFKKLKPKHIPVTSSRASSIDMNSLAKQNESISKKHKYQVSTNSQTEYQTNAISENDLTEAYLRKHSIKNIFRKQHHVDAVAENDLTENSLREHSIKRIFREKYEIDTEAYLREHGVNNDSSCSNELKKIPITANEANVSFFEDDILDDYF